MALVVLEVSSFNFSSKWSFHQSIYLKQGRGGAPRGKFTNTFVSYTKLVPLQVAVDEAVPYGADAEGEGEVSYWFKETGCVLYCAVSCPYQD